MKNTKELKPGQFVVYFNGASCNLGRVNTIKNDKQVFVKYSSGDTSALTNVADLWPIVNEEVIEKTGIKIFLFGREVL